MANEFDLLEAIGHHMAVGLSEISSGYEIRQIADAAGLLDQGTTQVAGWVSDLVADGYLSFRARSLGVPELLPGVRWTDAELQSHHGFRVTPLGRQELERIRRRRRDQATDDILNGHWTNSSEGLKSGLARPLEDLRAALDQKRHPAAVAAAKDLVEAACKSVLVEAGIEPGTGASLSHLYTLARRERAAPDADVGRSLTAIVDKLSGLRNAAGAGHGRAELDRLTEAEAVLAAAAACAVARFLVIEEQLDE